MKTQMQLQTLKSVAAIFFLAGALSIVGCKKNDGGGDPAPVPVPVAVGLTACQSCFANPVPMLSSVKSQTTGNELAFDLNIYVDPAMAAGLDLNNPYIESYYMGSAAFAGVLHLTAQIPGGMGCPVTPGDYTINTINAGQINRGMISGLRFEAIGPAGRMVMMVNSSEIYNRDNIDGVTRAALNNRIGMMLNLESVNNVPCGILATY